MRPSSSSSSSSSTSKPPKANAKAPRAGKLGRPKGLFTQHRKLDRLREALELHATGLTLAELAMVLRVSQRSVRRYLEELSRVKELESVPAQQGGAHTWRIKPSERARTVALRRSQAVGLLSLRKALEPLRGAALFDELDIAMTEIQRIAERPTRTSTRGEVSHEAALHRRFLFVPQAARNYANRGEDIDALFHAVAERRVLSIVDRVGKPFGFACYGLAFWNGSLLGVGVRDAGSGFAKDERDLRAERIEVIALEAMREVTVERPTFHLPDGFDIEQFFDGSLGPIEQASKTRVTVEFDARAADEIKTRRIHPTQKLALAADGRARITFTTHNLDAVLTWVLGFGPSARIVEPPSLVERVKKTLEDARARYP